MEFPKFRLRKSLYLIGQNMGGHDLASLKFLSSCYGVPKGQLERIETAFELFCALEDRGRIGYGNDAILRELLEARHREHLLVKYPLDEKEILETDAGGKSYNEGEKADLQKFLLGISDSLSKRDFKDLAYFLFDTDVNGTYSLQEIERMNSGIDLFEKLLAAKLIGPKNLTALYQVLEVIGRNDLCVRIAEYLPQSGAAERRRQKLESLPSVASTTSMSSSNTSISSMDASRPTSNVSHPTSSFSSSHHSMAFSPHGHYPSSYESDHISRDVGKVSRQLPPSAPPPPKQESTVRVGTGHQPLQQPNPQMNIRPPQGRGNFWIADNEPPNPPQQFPPPQTFQAPPPIDSQVPLPISQAPPPTTQSQPPVASEALSQIVSHAPPQATPMTQNTFNGAHAGYSPSETIVPVEEVGPGQDEPMETGAHRYPHPQMENMETMEQHSLLEQLEAENQTLKDIAAQQFQLIQDLHNEKEDLKKRDEEPGPSKMDMSTNSGVSCYAMDKDPHGIAIVIGNNKFQRTEKRPNLILSDRNGCLSDIYNFKSCFESLQYNVRNYDDCSASDIKKIIRDVAKEDHSNHDSFVFCISTHGEDNNYIFGSDSERIDVYKLISQICSCPTLCNKPKLFFIQACRARHVDGSIVSHDGSVVSSDGPNVPPVVNKEADVAIFWATTRSQSAYRSPRDGSWFVAALYKVFTTEAHRLDLVSMMYKVTQIVAEMEGRESSTREKVQQCVETSLQIRGAVYFNVA